MFGSPGGCFSLLFGLADFGDELLVVQHEGFPGFGIFSMCRLELGGVFCFGVVCIGIPDYGFQVCVG